MKKLFSCLLAIIIISICVVPCFAASPSLSVGVSSYEVNTGDTVTVNINLSANSGLGVLEFTVNYNPAEFQYVENSGVASGFTMAEFNPAYADGSIKYVGSVDTTDGNVNNNGGTVLSIKLRVLKYGGVISLSVNHATDADGNSVTVKKSNVKLSCAHSKMVWRTEKEATCTSPGTEAGVCICGHTDTREIPEIAHKYAESTIITEATCTKSGVEVGTCIVCNLYGAESVIPAKGHNYSNWVVTQEPTATTMGVKERVCSVCNDKQSQMVPALNEGPDMEMPTDEVIPTEPVTNDETIITTQPADSYFEIETEVTTGPSGGLFGNSSESDRAAVLVVILAFLLVVVLAVYIVLLRQRKKS